MFDFVPGKLERRKERRRKERRRRRKEGRKVERKHKKKKDRKESIESIVSIERKKEGRQPLPCTVPTIKP